MGAGVAARSSAQGLAESAGQDVDTVTYSPVLGRAGTSLAHESDGMGVVDHDHRTVPFGKITDLRQRCDETVHGEDAIGGDHDVLAPLALGVLELGLQVGHVLVVVAETLCLAQPDAVDDRGMVELVGDDGIVGPQQHLEETTVGVEAGRVQDGVPVVGVVGVQELGDGPLQLLVQGLGAADESHRGHAEAPLVEGLLGGVDEHR